MIKRAEDHRLLSYEKSKKDDFGDPFTMRAGELVFDAKTKDGPWAAMTLNSWIAHGVTRLGLGLGQCYARAEDGKLVGVHGFEEARDD